MKDIRKDSDRTEPAPQYAAAYAAHYTVRDLPLAFELYKQVIASHPGTPQAGYAAMQVRNIVNAVVPKQELMDVQMELVLAHFEHDGPHDTERSPST